MSLQPGLRDEVQVTLIATGFDQPRPGDAAGGAPWRPVWLRRAEEAAAPPQPAAEVTVRPKRRERRAAGRAAAEPGTATSLPASPESDVQG